MKKQIKVFISDNDWINIQSDETKEELKEMEELLEKLQNELKCIRREYKINNLRK